MRFKEEHCLCLGYIIYNRVTFSLFKHHFGHSFKSFSKPFYQISRSNKIQVIIKIQERYFQVRFCYLIVKGRLEASQLITNHYYLKGNGMFSVNRWNSGLVTCRSGIGGRQIVRWQTGQGDDANRGANAQGQIRWQIRKGWYDGKYVRADTRVICTKAVWGTADGEEYFEQLILRCVKQLILFENQNLGLG